MSKALIDIKSWAERGAIYETIKRFFTRRCGNNDFQYGTKSNEVRNTTRF